MTRVSTSEEGRAAGLGASSFSRAACAGACAGYEPCFVRMGQGYGEPSPWSTMQPEAVSVRVKGGTGVRLTRGDRSQASGSRSPPLEERVGERMPFTLLGIEVRGDIPAGCRANTSGRWAQNDDLLSLPLSSKGGEGNGAGAR